MSEKYKQYAVKKSNYLTVLISAADALRWINREMRAEVNHKKRKKK